MGSASASKRPRFEEDPRVERYTPPTLFRALDAEFRFDLDVCAGPASAKCRAFIDRERNGLKAPWQGRVWCNPPFNDIGSWVQKAWDEMASKRTELVVMLVPAWTDRKWWQQWVEPVRDMPPATTKGFALRTRFLPGRVRFGQPGDPEGVKAKQPAFWCCLLIWDGV